MGTKVTTIPAIKNKYDLKPITEVRRRRVAGYARVSTDSEEQATSYDAQVDYYTNYINQNPEWIFAGMYTDDGISATSTKRRKGFNEMIEDALEGKIDLIITKSCSRFARNTVDSLVTVRKLKEKGVEIYFEKENIWTLDAKGELLITIMSSLAQEESRSISENTTWGKRKSFADGKVSVAYSSFLGYDKDFRINEEEAKTVRLIYKLYLEGYSPNYIAKKLTEMNCKTPTGKNNVWWNSSVESILKNEKYKGDALLQKSFTTDFLTKKKKINEGEIPQYYVAEHHEPIIEPEVFDLVQEEMKKRLELKGYRGGNILASRIKCGKCACFYGPKVWHSNDKYRRVVYSCSHKYVGEKCTTPHLTEEQIKTIFVRAYNKYFSNKSKIMENLNLIIETMADSSELEEKAEGLLQKVNILADKINEFIEKNARTVQNQEEYMKKYDRMVNEYETKKRSYERANRQIGERKLKVTKLRQYKEMLENNNIEVISEFDADLWVGTISCFMVHSKKNIVVRFKDGTEIIETI